MGFRLKDPLAFSVKVPCWNWRSALGQLGLVAWEGLAYTLRGSEGTYDWRLRGSTLIQRSHPQ